MDKKKIIIILAILGIFLVLTSPVVAKEKVKIKISTADYVLNGQGHIIIKLVDKKGHDINSHWTIHYRITDSNGNYWREYKPYPGKLFLRCDVDKYKVKVKFDGDSHYKKAKKTKYVTVKSSSKFDPYTYYEDHNWGLNQRIDDYIEDNYWDEEIYDDPYTYDGEGYW